MSYVNTSIEIERLLRSQERDSFYLANSRREVMAADDAFARLSRRGFWYRLWARIRQKPYQLWNLQSMIPHWQVRAGYSAGLQLVPLAAIRGSEGKDNAFDRDFHPLHASHSRERWISIALARQRDKSLPPVELIKVDDGRSPVYFVRDGHHRISVARAFGQREIEASVSVWKLSRPAPWSVCQPTPHTVVVMPELC